MFVSLRHAVALTVGSLPVAAAAVKVTTLAIRPAPHVPAQLLGAVVLVCLGLLLGTTWTVQALQPKLRQQAEERRRLNEEWAAVRAIRWQETVCPCCASPLSGWVWYIAPTPVAEMDDDD